MSTIQGNLNNTATFPGTRLPQRLDTTVVVSEQRGVIREQDYGEGSYMVGR